MPHIRRRRPRMSGMQPLPHLLHSIYHLGSSNSGAAISMDTTAGANPLSHRLEARAPILWMVVSRDGISQVALHKAFVSSFRDHWLRSDSLQRRNSGGGHWIGVQGPQFEWWVGTLSGLPTNLKCTSTSGQLCYMEKNISILNSWILYANALRTSLSYELEGSKLQLLANLEGAFSQ